MKFDTFLHVCWRKNSTMYALKGHSVHLHVEILRNSFAKKDFSGNSRNEPQMNIKSAQMRIFVIEKDFFPSGTENKKKSSEKSNKLLSIIFERICRGKEGGHKIEYKSKPSAPISVHCYLRWTSGSDKSEKSEKWTCVVWVLLFFETLVGFKKRFFFLKKKSTRFLVISRRKESVKCCVTFAK